MVAANCHRSLTTVAVLALSWLAAAPLSAQDARLVANCSAPAAGTPAPASDPKAPAGQPTFSVTCNVHATEAATFQGMKATIKGRSEPLEASFKPFDAKNDASSVMFLIQVLEPQRTRTAQQMADAVIKIAEARDGKRRFAAYSFANDLNLVAGFDANKADFEKAVRGIRSVSLPTQLYQTALDAIDKLAKEPGERKSLVIVGDGNSDDTGYTHEQVVQAAKQAGIAIHTLGYVEVTAEMPRFQLLRRLAEDTGGFRREVRQTRDGRFTLTPKFASEVLENGGTVKISLKEPPGPLTLALSADLGNGRTEAVEHMVTIPAPAKPEPPVKPVEKPQSWEERAAAWVKENRYISYAIGLGLLLASFGFLLFAFGRKNPAPGPVTTATSAVSPDKGKAVVYGWLEMLDGNATRHPLNTTNVRIGRHRDNDVCLQNDSISRRHAVLHYNADHKRFVITDLGTENGVLVNNVRQKSHELSDGDLIELGEVRLRFRANMEFVG